MKQNADEPDYRSINEVQLKSELIKLEKKILDITGDPIDYKHYSSFLDWCRNDAKVEAVEEMMLDRCFILNLLSTSTARRPRWPIRNQSTTATCGGKTKKHYIAV